VKNRESFFHLHMISDATGETLLTVGRAAAAQHVNVRAIEHIHAMVRAPKQLDRVITALEEQPGIVLYTLVDSDLSALLEAACRRIGIPCVSVLEPVLQTLQSYLGVAGTRRVGAQHVLDAEYFRRIDALNFTMLHDDGQLAGSLEDADVVLVGISRTSKTPTSIYLANRGIKTANIPIVPGIRLPAQLEEAKRPLIVGLTASPERIVQLRENRVLGLNAAAHGESYVDKAVVASEVAFTRKLCQRHGWPIIDVTRRSIEETAADIMTLHQAARAELEN
jgi:regulator of PEP synthase PpsR (kinase-PPPase family)